MKEPRNEERTRQWYNITTDNLFLVIVLDPLVISVVAANPTDKHLYGLDRGMNFLRSTDRGSSWEAISHEYFKRAKKRHALSMSSGIPDNLTGTSPSSSLSVISSQGTKWGGK